jgi:dihydrodipicolinate reductase
VHPIPNQFEGQKKGEREKGRKGEREKGRKEDAVACSRGANLPADHDCGFAGSGGFFS